jgi:hypothetical protein
MNVRLSVVRVWDSGKWMRTIGWCMLFLGMVAAAKAAENATETQTTLSVATNNAGPRTRAALTAHVGADLAGSPTGVVTFRSGEVDLGSAFLDGEGNASLETDVLPAGDHQVVAVYQGKAAYSPSTSKPEVLHANASTVAGFTVTATPTSLSTAAGGFVKTVVTITPVNGFNGFVSLSCSGLPLNATCTFSTINVPADCTTTCTPGTSTMEIQTQAPSPGATARNGNSAGFARYAFVFPVLFGLAGLGARNHRAWRNLSLGLLAVVWVMGMTGCAQRYRYLNHGPPDNPGTPTGNYTITVNASSSVGSFTTTPPTQPQIALSVTGGSAGLP